MTENITNLDELKKAIAVLELEKAEKEEQLQAQFNLTLKSIIAKTVLGAAVGISSGFALKKIFVRGSANVFRILFGTLVQAGTVKLLSRFTRSRRG